MWRATPGRPWWRVVGALGADHLSLRAADWHKTTHVEQNKHFRAKAVGALLSTTSGPDGPTAANHRAVGAALLKTATATSIAFGKYGTAGDWASSTSMVGRCSLNPC